MGEADRAYEKALCYLEKRDRTESEVSRKLIALGFSEDTIAGVVERLRGAGLVDDADYADRYLQALAAKGRGRLRIASEMRRKGLPDELVRNALEDGIDSIDERARALEAARKAWAGIPEETDARKAKAKVNRRLVSLGFSYSVIGDVIGEVCKPEEEEL